MEFLEQLEVLAVLLGNVFPRIIIIRFPDIRTKKTKKISSYRDVHHSISKDL